MRQSITAERIRSVIGSLRTEKAAAEALRRHRIRYELMTGSAALRVHTRSGYVYIVRTGPRSAPLAMLRALETVERGHATSYTTKGGFKHAMV